MNEMKIEIANTFNIRITTTHKSSKIYNMYKNNVVRKIVKEYSNAETA